MKIKITQPGMDKFTGPIGPIVFDNGVSVDEVSTRDAQRLRAAFKIETVEGDDPGLLAQIARRRVGEPDPESLKEKEPEIKVKTIDYDFTEDSLVETADKRGIAGLREIADRYQVKGNSIALIIDKLMALKRGE